VNVKVRVTASAGWEATAEMTAKPTTPMTLLKWGRKDVATDTIRTLIEGRRNMKTRPFLSSEGFNVISSFVWKSDSK
jgi:hypothetical protein